MIPPFRRSCAYEGHPRVLTRVETGVDSRALPGVKGRALDWFLPTKELTMVRALTLSAAVLALVGVGAAQTTTPQKRDPRSIKLRGNRFKPLTYDEMTPAQKTMVGHLLAGPRGGVNGPFNVLLRSPEIGDFGQEFGASTRFRSSLPQKLYELAILVTARHWTSQYEWQAHHRSALQAGLSPAIADAIAQGRRPAAM